MLQRSTLKPSSSIVSFTQCSPTCGRMPLPALSLWPGRQPYRPRLVGGRRGGGPSSVAPRSRNPLNGHRRDSPISSSFHIGFSNTYSHLDGLFPIFLGVGLVLLHYFRSRATSWVTPTPAMSSFICWCHVFLGRPRRLVRGTVRSITLHVRISYLDTCLQTNEDGHCA